MTSQGHPQARFHRALARGNFLQAVAEAHDLPSVPLADALALCLLAREEDDTRYTRYVVRWHARYVTEIGLTSATESQITLLALIALGSPDEADSARRTLIDLFDSHGRADLGERL